MIEDLRGRVILVTGASTGIGAAVARAFGANGARVGVHCNASRDAAEAVAADIRAAGSEALVLQGDLGASAACRDVVAAAIRHFGRLDVLVNNAGVLRDRMSFNMTEEEFDLVMKVHCKGHFAMNHHACVRWREEAKSKGSTWGRVVNTASEAGLMGTAGNSNYAMAKAAICALTISIAREMGKYGVTSNFIAPRARTRMTQSMPNSSMFDAPENGFDAFHPAWPAQLVVFLASEQAADLNGQGFIVWGGEVQLVSGWHKVGGVATPGAPLHARDLIARKDELFGSQPRQPTYM